MMHKHRRTRKKIPFLKLSHTHTHTATHLSRMTLINGIALVQNGTRISYKTAKAIGPVLLSLLLLCECYGIVCFFFCAHSKCVRFQQR